MNNNIENIFIKKFINKINQDRLKFELGSEKHRLDGIERFAHNVNQILKQEKIFFQGRKLTLLDVSSILLDNGCHEDDEVYLISTGKEDGSILLLDKALQICFDDYSPSIIICNENLAFIKAETSIGSPLKLILKYT